jgi:predicted hydrocarbon binding protein
MLPNKLIRSFLVALEDLLGKNGVNAILNLSALSDWAKAYPPDDEAREVANEDLSRIQKSLEEIYGERMGRNLSRRAARSSFNQVGAELININAADKDSIATKEKIKLAFDAFAELFSSQESRIVQFSLSGDQMFCEFQACPNCVERKADEPICHTCAGWIEGLLDLTISDVEFEISETKCIAAGDSGCVFTIYAS